jgi:mannose-6-phosphate isomerase-like protein (cupin superfamily)
MSSPPRPPSSCSVPAYPPVTYTGSSGEVSARLRPQTQQPDLVYPAGVRVDYLSTGAASDGRFGLYRWRFGPGRGGADPHFHRTISESFYVLGGVVQLYDGRGWVDAGAGDFLHVPEGGVHGFHNVPEAGPASMLILFAPGAPRESYFEGLAAGLAEMTEQERAAFYLAHDNHWVDG